MMKGRVLSVRDTAPRDDDDRFERIAEGHYSLTAPESMNTDLEIDHVRRERYQLYGELVVHTGLPGALRRGVLFTASINLSSLRERDTVARTLQSRTQTADLDLPKWRALVDELAIRVKAAEDVGTPAVHLRDVPPRSPERWHRSHGFTLPAHSPAMIFGDGDSAKSYSSDAIALDLAWQGLTVAIADWEMTEDEHAERIRRLCAGQPVPGNLVYLHCTKPLVHERDRIATALHQTGAQYLICDSAGFACHDKPETADAALVYFREIRRLAVGSLHIAHMTKGEHADQKPFGSAFWFNSVRALWYAKRAEAGIDPAVVEVGFYPRKFNLAARPGAHALRFTFSDDVTSVTPIEATDVESLAAGTSIRERLRHMLRQGARTIAELADELDAKPDTVKKALVRGSGQAFICLTDTKDGIQRWALLEKRVS